MRQLKSFILPFAVLVIVPFLLLFDFSQPRLRVSMPHPIAQMAIGIILCVPGLIVLITTISRFIRRGRGTLAPWDPPSRSASSSAWRRSPHMELVSLPLGKALYESGDQLNHVYFATTSVVSLL